MNQDQILNIKKNIEILIDNLQLYNVFNSLRDFINNISSIKFIDELDDLETTYKYLIQYLAEGIEDPQRAQIYNKLVLSLYVILDKIVLEALRIQSSDLFYCKYRVSKIESRTISDLFDSYRNTVDKISLITDSSSGSELENNNFKSLTYEKERLEISIFDKLMVTYPFAKEDVALINAIIDDSSYPLYAQELIISALLLGTLKVFDENKINIILTLCEHSIDKIRIKAIVALVFILLKHNKRLPYYSLINEHLRLLEDNPEFCESIRNIVFQIIRSQETDQITKKMQEEVIPELMKLGPQIYKKFNSDSTSQPEELKDENPDWDNIFENSEISKKIQELNELQLEGGDVFMGTFAQLKRFPFFNEISNWFLPFHKHHSLALNFLNSDDKIISIISHSSYLCSSDKYSFLLSIMSVPELQRNLMTSQLKSQNIDIKELQNSELTTSKNEKGDISNRYIQELYRFFKLFYKRYEFDDPFAGKLNIFHNDYFKLIFNDLQSLQVIGEFYLKKSHYQEAAEIFIRILSLSSSNAELLQKIGFCYQQISLFEKSLDYYLKAELISDNNLWTLRHIATVYKALKEPEKALNYYQRALALSSDNLNITLNIGHLLFEFGKIDEALKYYYKVDFLSSGSNKAWRPIAWCEFLKKNFEQSKKYYDKILNGHPTPQDYLNMGHLSLVCKNNMEAFNFYKESILAWKGNFNEFDAAFKEDIHELSSFGIEKSELLMIKDKLRYDL